MASEMPERMFAGSYSALGAPDTGYWHPVETPSTGTEYVLATTHQRALEALEEARERVEHWADVASRADRTRYDTSDDLAKIDAALTRIKGDVT